MTERDSMESTSTVGAPLYGPITLSGSKSHILVELEPATGYGR